MIVRFARVNGGAFFPLKLQMWAQSVASLLVHLLRQR